MLVKGMRNFIVISESEAISATTREKTLQKPKFRTKPNEPYA